MKNDGTKTATTSSIASRRGVMTSALASSTARGNGRASREVRVNVLDRRQWPRRRGCQREREASRAS
jgi:hypothetical protein